METLSRRGSSALTSQSHPAGETTGAVAAAASLGTVAPAVAVAAALAAAAGPQRQAFGFSGTPLTWRSRSDRTMSFRVVVRP